jgi:uncharacterized protein YndB with AHSA1/START domain
MPPSGKSLVEYPSDREVIFTRVLDAPRELVWELWSELKHLHEWYGPLGFTTTTHEFSFVPNGVWRLIMHGPDGTDYPTLIVFREIDPPNRLVFENGWDRPDSHLDFEMVVTLVPEGKKTRLSMHMTFIDIAAFEMAVQRYGVLEGGKETLEHMAQYLSRLA